MRLRTRSRGDSSSLAKRCKHSRFFFFSLSIPLFPAWANVANFDGSDRAEESIKDIQKKIDAKRGELIQLQAAGQAAAQAAAQGAEGKGKEVAA